MKDLQQMLIEAPQVKESGMSATDVPQGAELALIVGATVAICIYFLMKGFEDEKGNDNSQNTQTGKHHPKTA